MLTVCPHRPLASALFKKIQELVIFRIQLLLFDLFYTLGSLNRIRQFYISLNLLLLSFLVKFSSAKASLIFINDSFNRSSDTLIILSDALTDLEASKFLQQLQTLSIFCF